MKLDNSKVDFLCRFYERFNEREFIIDTMTQVGNRPMLEVYPSEMLSESEHVKTIEWNSTPPDAKYVKPYGLDMLPEHLKSDPVHKWRAETGCELIHQEPDLWELIRIWRNWNLMDDSMKAMSEGESNKLFGCSNAEHFKSLVRNWMDQAAQKKRYLVGDLVMLIDSKHDKSCVAYIVDIDDDKGTLTYAYLGSGDTRIFGETDTFDLPGNVLKCYQSNEKLPTTVGRFLLNVLLVECFEGKVAYHNQAGFDLKGLEKDVAGKMLDGIIAVKDYKHYVDNLFFIGHFTELCVPTFTRASLTTDPNIKKLKEELFKQYAGRLEEPEVIAEIENQLIAADKKYLEHDKSMRFFKPLGGKPFNIARKKMYLTVGGIEAFSKDSGKYTFIQNALADGWDTKAMPAIANEIRKGSYNRGHETQLGGAQTKYIVRVFQDFVLTEDDCHSTRGIKVDFSKHDPKEFVGRYILINGKWTEILKDDLSKYTGKQYVMRSPMYCQTKHGMCKTCAGRVFAKLNTKHLSMFIVDISSTFTTMSLKMMHGSKLEMVDLGDLNQYLV